MRRHSKASDAVANPFIVMMALCTWVVSALAVGVTAYGQPLPSVLTRAGIIDVVAGGARCDGVSDDSAALNKAAGGARAFSDGAAYGGIVMIPAGRRCRVDSTLEIPWGASFEASGAVLDFRHLKGGVAIQIGFNGPPAQRLERPTLLRFGVVLGPGADSATVGIRMGGGSSQSAATTTDVDLDDTTVSGFGIGVQFGNNAFNDHLHHDSLSQDGVAIADIPGAVDMGAQMSVSDTAFAANGHDLHIGAIQEFDCERCSFGDNSSIPFVILYGNRTYKFDACRFENGGRPGETASDSTPVFVDIVGPVTNLMFDTVYFTMSGAGVPVAWDNTGIGSVLFLNSRAEGGNPAYSDLKGGQRALAINSPSISGPVTQQTANPATSVPVSR